MSTLAETLADPSRPSFLFGGSSIFRAPLCLSLSLSLSASSSSSSCYARVFLLRSARAHPNPLLDRKASNPIGAHKTGQKARARKQRKQRKRSAVLSPPSLARCTRAPNGD